MLFIVQIAW